MAEENKQRVTVPYGIDENGIGKALVFEVDVTKKEDVEFANDLEAVSATKPKNLLELFTRFIEIQKMPKS